MATGNRRRTRRKKYNSRTGIVLVTVVMACFLVVMGFRMKSLSATAKSYDDQVAALEEELAQEEQRAQDLEEEKAYVQTRQYVEQIARDRLGLVGPDEVVVKPNE